VGKAALPKANNEDAVPKGRGEPGLPAAFRGTISKVASPAARLAPPPKPPQLNLF